MMSENKRYYIGEGESCIICDSTKEGNCDFYKRISDFEAVDRLNEQEEEIRRLNHLVKIATYLIESNTVLQVRREWQKHLSKVGDVDD